MRFYLQRLGGWVARLDGADSADEAADRALAWIGGAVGIAMILVMVYAVAAARGWCGLRLWPW